MLKIKPVFILFSLLLVPLGGAFGARPFETDTIRSSGGTLAITFIGHASVMFEFEGKVIQVDPVGRLADYSSFPKADLVLVTHEHSDHFDPAAIRKVSTEETIVVCTAACAEKLPDAVVMANGDERTVDGIGIAAVPAYNVVHRRPDGSPWHPKGVGNGYVVRLGGLRVYVAGDTEDIPEMKRLEEIDIAFLPMNLPYTMTPEMVADAAESFLPRILYPYHTGDTDVSTLAPLLEKTPSIDVRIRRMK